MTVTDLAYIDSTGYNYADFPSFLAYYQSIFTGNYGSDIYLGADSQDGQFVTQLAQAAYDTAALGAGTFASFLPTNAQGTGLSRLVKLNGLNRILATNSTVELVIVGQYLTLLENCIAIDVLQQQWSIPTTTIPSSGTITVTATAVTPGAISASANTITGIFTPTNGWQTVNNPAPATVGQAAETDAALRIRQASSTSIAAQTVFDATLAALGNVAGVVKVAPGYENDTASTDANGLPPHSVAFVVSGGLDTDVAQAIQVKKTPGTQTYGTTSVVVYDSRNIPITINFFRPTQAEIGVQITIAPFSNYVGSTASLIQAAISSYILSLPIGGSVVLTQLYAVAYLVGNPLGATYNIVSIEIEKNGGGFGTSNINLAFNEIATCDPTTDVTVLGG